MTIHHATTRKLRNGLGVAISLGLLTLIYSPSASAHNYLGQCTPNFDNKFALTNIYANARNTFAFRTGFNAQGRLDTCSNVPAGNPCWTYRHRCWLDYVNVEDFSHYGHYHLSFTDPNVNPALCGFGDPGDGYGAGFKKLVNNRCVIPDWTTEPRVLNSHDGAQWIGIRLTPQGSITENVVFDMPRIRIGGTTPVQLWFHSTLDNLWYFWSSLGPGNWDISPWAHDIDIVEISGASGQTNSFEIDDFDILD
jgi:hypothetical protein